MERLRQSAVGSGGDVLLRYGYVPPSLRRMHGQQRDRKAHLMVRLALIGVTTFLLAVSAYRGTRLVAPLSPPIAPLFVPQIGIGQADPETPPAVLVVPFTSAAEPPVLPPPVVSGDGVPGDLVTGAGAAPIATGSDEIQLPARPRAVAAAQTRPVAPTPAPVPALDTAGLSQVLQSITSAAVGSYGISVIDLTSGQNLDLNATSPMNAASVNKLEILAALYHQVEAGQLKLDQTLTMSAANRQDYGTGVMRYQPLGTRYTLAQLATVLIEQSDNTASYMLAQCVGLDTIDALVAQWGLKSTIVGQEVSTPADAAHFMQLLYQGKLANATDTNQMLQYLTHTAFHDRIPAGLPADVVVAHKIGTQVNVENDVALVALPGRPYILSIFAKDVTEEDAVPVEQAISRAVYQFEQQTAKGGA